MGEGMTSRTIGCDGLDELPDRKPHEHPVEYLITLRAMLTTDVAGEFEDCDEVILRHPQKPALIRATVLSAEVVK
jgi:hypothetical protein